MSESEEKNTQEKAAVEEPVVEEVWSLDSEAKQNLAYAHDAPVSAQ